MTTPAAELPKPKTRSLRLPLGFNFSGRMLAGAIAFVATPVYFNRLGSEAFGLVGFYLLIQSLLGFVNSGLADAANREIAVADANDSAKAIGRWMGFSRVAWVIAPVLAGGIWLLAPLLAKHWLTLDRIPVADAVTSIRLMGVLCGLQVPLDYYVGASLALRRHLFANCLLVGTAALRAVASVAALVVFSHSPLVFFFTQVACSVVAALACVIGFIPMTRGHRSLPVWRESRRFSLGMTAISLSGLVLSQADRLIMSNTLRLDQFAIYSLATTLANLLYFVIGPIQSVYYPEFSRLTREDQATELSRIYHEGCQRMLAIVAPVGAILIFFARDLLIMWTRQSGAVAAAAPVVMFLVAARMIGGINGLPYSLQFANGWTSFVLRANTLAIIVFVPVVYLLASYYGAVGAAAGYLVLSLPFLALVVWRLHRRLLRHEAGRWLMQDTLPYLVCAAAIAAVWRFAEPAELSRVSRWLWVGAASACTLAGTVLLNRPTRLQVLRLFQARRTTP